MFAITVRCRDVGFWDYEQFDAVLVCKLDPGGDKALDAGTGVPNFSAAQGKFMIMMPLRPIPNFFDAP